MSTELCKECFHPKHVGNCPAEESYWMRRLSLEYPYVPTRSVIGTLVAWLRNTP